MVYYLMGVNFSGFPITTFHQYMSTENVFFLNSSEDVTVLVGGNYLKSSPILCFFETKTQKYLSSKVFN